MPVVVNDDSGLLFPAVKPPSRSIGAVIRPLHEILPRHVILPPALRWGGQAMIHSPRGRVQQPTVAPHGRFRVAHRDIDSHVKLFAGIRQNSIEGFCLSSPMGEEEEQRRR